MKTCEVATIMRQHLSPLYPDSELNAFTRIILEDVMHYSPVDAVMRAQDELPEFFVTRLGTIISRLQHHEPLQYILGKARFHGHDFKVTPATLIPRPETEQLVDMIVDDNGGREDLVVVDLGTGSGCIAISLARALKFATVTGIDISHEALAVARENAAALKARVKWLEADILELPAMPAAGVDIVVSNPPYITMAEKSTMERNVLDYEPHEALFVPGSDPLLFYRAIVDFAAQVLKPRGRIYLEINSHYGNEITSLLHSAGMTSAAVHHDSYGNTRFATATMPG